MSNRSLTALVCGLLMVCAAPALAQSEKQPGKKPDAKQPKPAPAKSAPDTQASLKVGDAAPALTYDSHIKGDKVTSLEKGKVYVVEFWATWCPPCIKNIPHLTELQKKYNGKLTVIGVAASERAPDSQPDQREDKLKQFVREQGKKMEYTVVYDSKRAMSAAWMAPAGMNSIPTAFVVDGEGKLAYIGHPNGMDKVIEGLVGKKDDKKDKKKEAPKEPKKTDPTDPGTTPPKETQPSKQPG